MNASPTPVVNSVSKNRKDVDMIKMIINRVLDLIMIEINKTEMKENIQKKIVHPLLYMIYCQLYPYIYIFIIILLLMFLILITILIFFILYLKR